MLKIFFAYTFCVLIYSCSTKTGSGIAKKTARDKYAEQVKTVLGPANPALSAWQYAGEYALNYPLAVNNNYAEAGYFAPATQGATAFAVAVKRGMKLTVTLRKKEPENVKMYMDMWRAGDSATRRPRTFIISADTSSNIIYYTAGSDETILIRFQKEIGKGGGYYFNMETGPSFVFPVRSDAKSNIGSLWGDPRDGGARRHEGVDIMAPRGSPLVAVADGVISFVGDDPVGGKIIYLRPRGTSYKVYYAHLDTQLTETDKEVRAGELIGTVGNTGNASTTVPHLHFGIYTGGGAVDPLVFIKPAKSFTPKTFIFPAKTNMVTVKNAQVFNDIQRNVYYALSAPVTPP